MFEFGRDANFEILNPEIDIVGDAEKTMKDLMVRGSFESRNKVSLVSESEDSLIFGRQVAQECCVQEEGMVTIAGYIFG